MTAVVERQRWMGALALAVALPLPFTGVVSLPFLLPFVAAALAALLARRPLAPLRPWLENLLAPAILLAVIAAGGMRFGVLRPVAQLAVLLVAVRLPGCGLRARTAHVGGLIALIGVAGVASSTHPILALYVLLMLTFVTTAVARMAIVAGAEGVKRPAPPWPPARLVAPTVIVAALVAVPLFVLVPRLRSPFAATAFGGRPVSGFREAVALHRLGDVKLSQALALEVTFEPDAKPDPEWLRLGGATLRYYRAGSWVQGRRSRQLLSGDRNGLVRLAEPDPRFPIRRAEIALYKDVEHLFVPPGAVELELPPSVPVWRDRLGTLTIPRRVDTPVRYAVHFQPGRVTQTGPAAEDLELPPGSAPVEALARELARGSRNSVVTALAIESHLRARYRYTTSTDAPLRLDPVQWFLFSSRQGHCEFFASSMVMLLRGAGIPARMQAGFAGGEPDGDGGWLVRDSNAHAWVVAWVGARWAVFDPTPAEGRPPFSTEPGAWSLARAWQQLEAAWDRWILTFSLADQVELVSRAIAALRAVSLRWPLALVTLLVASALPFGVRAVIRALVRIGPRRTSALGGAIARTAALARRRGLVPPAELTPRALAAVVAEAVPAAGPPLRWLVSRHEKWLYGAGDAPHRGEVRRAAHAVARALAVAGRKASS